MHHSAERRDLERVRGDARSAQLACAGLAVEAAQGDEGLLDALEQAESLLHNAVVALDVALERVPGPTLGRQALPVGAP